MDDERWRRVERVLDAALSTEPATWPALLDELCGPDPLFRLEVEALLARADTARGFLAAPPVALAAALFEAPPAEPLDRYEGRRIGAYRLLREIGRGGMARVYLAERADGQFEQYVALKLLRPGLDSDADRDRFRAERQILASLDHPNIARLLDGGIDDAGQPYLALEHVEGHPIDRYCDDGALPLHRRLELFLNVCEAVQHAHRRLVVHRDIKPSNILVDAGGRPRLLDFGLAKLLAPDHSGTASGATRTGQRWMTPEYAAPEQVRGEPVTTLTDVYQLGALLYRLLAGRPPFSGIRESAFTLESAVLAEAPEPPSSAAARLDAARAMHLRGDIDAILLKALRKEPEQRYGSVEQLADDVARYLARRPVLARRGRLRYRLGKLARRRRIETAAAAAVCASLLLGTGVSAEQARRAAVERDRAELARERAEAAMREAEAVSHFLLGLFEPRDPAEARGDTLTARELVRRGAARAERLHGQPAVQARMLEVTARVYHGLGEFSEAHTLLERALAVQHGADAGGDLDAARTLGHLADVRLRLGRYAAADSAARRALEIQDRLLGGVHPAVAASLHRVASLAVYRGDLAAADTLHRRALEVRRSALGPADSLTGVSHLAVGSIHRRRARLVQAEREYRRALAIFEQTLGPDHPETAEAVLHIAYLLDEDLGRHAEAEPLYRRAIAIRRRAFGDAHPNVAYAISDLARLMTRRGDPAAASLAREHLEILRLALGPEHPVVITSVSNTAGILHRVGESREAEALYRAALDLERRVRGPDHPSVVGPETGLARLLVDRGDHAGAEALLHDAVRIRELVGGRDHYNTAAVRALLGMVLGRSGRFAAADSLMRDALRVMEGQTDRTHRDLREIYGWLAELHLAQGRPADAARFRTIAAGG